MTNNRFVPELQIMKLLRVQEHFDRSHQDAESTAAAMFSVRYLILPPLPISYSHSIYTTIHMFWMSACPHSQVPRRLQTVQLGLNEKSQKYHLQAVCRQQHLSKAQSLVFC
jgi:hypothetical protein